jgi:hypothetical protein
MILFYGEGRLGNQILQYQALSHIARADERIFAVGLEDLQQILVLHGPRLVILTRNGLVKRAIKYIVIPFLLRPLSRTLRLIRYVHESQQGTFSHREPSGELFIRTGVLRAITFVDGGYYQNASLWTSMFPTALYRVNDALKRAASAYLDSQFGPTNRPAFVHVRRGDYLRYSAYGSHDLVLPADFFRRAIREMDHRIGPTPFIFVTDDAAWVNATFHDIPNKTVVNLSAAMDFAVMTECTAGILSNSTFSLAAALMLEEPQLIIAPLYWLGFRVARWLPPRIQIVHERFLYLPVLPEPPAAH